MKHYHLAIVIEKDKDGYFAYAPELQGCYTQGESFEETLENIKDAIKLHIEDKKARNEKLPSSDVVSIATLEVTA